MSSPSRSFPKGWPENCPPSDASESAIIVYRTVASDPPTAEDFLSYAEEGKRILDPAKRCLAHGLSVMLTLKDAQHHREILRWKNQHIAKGTLDAAHGVTKATPSGRFPSHVTWWCLDGVKRESLFSVMEE